MASTLPLGLEYAYVLLRGKMGMHHNFLTSSAMLCRYGDTNDVFPIGGLVDIGETPIPTDSRHYHQLVNFVLKPHDHLFLFRAQKELKDLMLVRSSLYILDIKAEYLTMIYF
jgi:hypothetical protein